MAKKNALVAAHLAPLKKSLDDQKAAILETLQPQYAKLDALNATLQPLEAERRALGKAIAVAEAPLREIGNNLAQIERTIGSTSMPLEAGTVDATPSEVG